ncbi:MAG: serine hydrolase [Alphaproteobacteria bacterium]|nr:serine hydrolase [Alphaproteobacteria bacterium]
MQIQTQSPSFKIGDLTINRENWDTGPHNRWAYRNIDKLVNVKTIATDHSKFHIFRRGEKQLDRFQFHSSDGTKFGLDEYLEHSFCDGFLVLHRGEIILENYYNGMQENELHLSQSVCKSVTGILVGILVDEGILDTSKTAADYVPDLDGCVYGEVTLKNLLNMSSGVSYTEDYSNPSREYLLLEQCAGWNDRHIENAPKSFHAYLKSIGYHCPQGTEIFNYRSIDTDILAWVCEEATRQPFNILLSTYIWKKLACDFDAQIKTDHLGAATASGGLNASLRDYGRFGQMIINNGTFNNQKIVSENWISSSLQGHPDAFRLGYPAFSKTYPNGTYSNQWWVLDSEDGIQAAIGIHGQFIYIDRSADIVVVKLSTWPEANNHLLETSDLKLFHDLGTYLNS